MRKFDTEFSKLSKKYIYYLTFLLNPDERQKSTILEKKSKYTEFKGIFDGLPKRLSRGQEFVKEIFKCDTVSLNDLKDLFNQSLHLSILRQG